MSQWAEVRHLHLVEDVPKKEIARRLKLDVKTVRRAIGRPTPPVRVSPLRPSTLDPWRERISQWLSEEPRLTAKWIRRLLLPLAGPVPARTVRRCVAGLRAAGSSKEALRTPQRAPWDHHGGRLRRVVGRHRRRAAQGEVPGGDAAVLQRVLRQGVPGRAARVAARRHRVGLPLLRGPRGPRRPRQHLAGGQGRVGGPGPGRDRGVRDGREIRQESRAPAAAGGRELERAPRGAPEGRAAERRHGGPARAHPHPALQVRPRPWPTPTRRWSRPTSSTSPRRS